MMRKTVMIAIAAVLLSSGTAAMAFQWNWSFGTTNCASCHGLK